MGVEQHTPMYSRKRGLQLFLAGNVLTTVVSGGSLVMKHERKSSTVVTYLPQGSETFGQHVTALLLWRTPEIGLI